MEKRPDDSPSHGENGGMRWLGPLGRWINRRLNAPTGADPLYLSNRTLGQKMKTWVLVAVPCLALVAVVCYGLVGGRALVIEPHPAVISPVHVETARDLEVVQVQVVHGATTALEGTIRNDTAHVLSAEVVFDLTDAHGSQLGGVTMRVNNLQPHVLTPFHQPIRDPRAALALVRALNRL